MGIVAGYAVPHPPLIIPAVGRGQEHAIQETIDAYYDVAREIAAIAPDVLVISSPHAPLYRDAFHLAVDERFEGSMAQFRAPDERVSFPGDAELANLIIENATAQGIPVGPYGGRGLPLDHASYIPLWFLAHVGFEAPVVLIGLSGLSHETHLEVGRIIAESADELERRAVWIASGDLSHKLKEDGPYGFAPEGPVFDERICELFEAGDLERLSEFDDAFADAAAECGLRSFRLMAGALEGLPYDARLLSHQGTFGVGYGVAAFRVKDPYVDLARRTIETWVRTGARPEAPATGELATRRAGAFVSLHRDGDLRGCIGTIAACEDTLGEEIVSNAISACSRDPRFLPVGPDELDDLEISVDVLGDAEPATEADLDPRRYGVIVSNGRRRGLLLPDLEGVDTVEDQIAISRKKAGIGAGEPVELQRFEVVRHGRYL